MICTSPRANASQTHLEMLLPPMSPGGLRCAGHSCASVRRPKWISRWPLPSSQAPPAQAAT
eukprot:4190844-Lingulodinium_polyedra.AAC.1